ncbi:hypothetical protein BDB01DRAFT_718880 [Pilobolus umbonatus]|nr:hypothetical protein BDB01DRAFT_718880 [Pilobolus umbonatus]
MKIYSSVKIIIAALVFNSCVHAACQGDYTVSNQQDLDKIRTCKNYSGNIRIENTAAPELKLNGVELLEGDLIVSNNDVLQTLSFPVLQGINGNLKLMNNKIMSRLDVSQLYALRTFDVSVHPALNEIKFSTGLSQADNINIADTTIARLDGFKIVTAREITITNNIYLKNLSFSNMTSVGNMLISANSPTLNLELTKLETTRDLTLRNVASITMSSLSKATGDISFISNSFDSLEIPEITDITGTLTLTDNLQLNNVSMPKLSHLGGALSVGGNSKLMLINSFPSLQQVDGTVDITGGFDEIQLPSLSDVSSVYTEREYTIFNHNINIGSWWNECSDIQQSLLV